MSADFNGSDIDQQLDGPRLTRQLDVIREHLIIYPEWHTLHGLAQELGYSEASISAQLRNLRKKRFGGWEVARRRAGQGGTWEYRLGVKLSP